MRKFTGKMVAALLAGTLLFSSVPTVYGAEMDEKVVTEGVETTSEVTDDVQLSEAEESLIRQSLRYRRDCIRLVR